MSVCAVILAGLQGKYAFYAAMPVALTFGKKFKNLTLLYSVDVRVYANHKVFFSLRATFSASDKLGLHLLKKSHYYGSIKIPYEITSEDNDNNNKTNYKKSSSPHGPKFLADC